MTFLSLPPLFCMSAVCWCVHGSCTEISTQSHLEDRLLDSMLLPRAAMFGSHAVDVHMNAPLQWQSCCLLLNRAYQLRLLKSCRRWIRHVEVGGMGHAAGMRGPGPPLRCATTDSPATAFPFHLTSHVPREGPAASWHLLLLPVVVNVHP